MKLYIHNRISFFRYSNVLILALTLILSGCGGGSSNTNLADSNSGGGSNGGGGSPAPSPAPTTPAPGGGNPACTTTGTATASYAISWDNLYDPNNTINGYKVYFGTNSQVTTQNATGSFSVSGTSSNNNYVFKPGDYSLQACTTYYFAVASVTVAAVESQLSSTVSILIE